MANKTCQNCGSSNFRPDEDGDQRCVICGRYAAIAAPPEKSKPRKVKPKIEVKKGRHQPEETSQQRAMKRYRRSPLYRKTRRRHDLKWRKSKRGKQIQAEHNQRASALRRLDRKLKQLGLWD